MHCPKCATKMDDLKFEGVIYRRCEGCSGIWFDGIAHKALKRIPGSDSIDIGTEAQGHELDGMTDVKCPECGRAMNRRRDKFQPHIRYETCPMQHGVFFDAGEFRDFKEETLGDFFRSLSWYFRKSAA
ncbi:MAG: zf-TFIIB domain-containing protein [Fibrobacteria bacterium]